jgi:hypothetical protein
MKRTSGIVVVLSLIVGRVPKPVLGEDLKQTWDLAIRANAQLQAQQCGIDGGGVEPQSGKIRSVALGT